MKLALHKNHFGAKFCRNIPSVVRNGYRVENLVHLSLILCAKKKLRNFPNLHYFKRQPQSLHDQPVAHFDPRFVVQPSGTMFVFEPVAVLLHQN